MVSSKKVTLKVGTQEKLKPLLILSYCFGFKRNEFDTFSVFGVTNLPLTFREHLKAN